MDYDVIIIGAGGAGMMCATQAGLRGRKVLLVDHATELGRKILISGGGRCNFTNQGASPENYVSRNPHFCKSALSRYTPDDFIQMVQRHRISFHEKKLGQLFCDDSARQIVQMLQVECQQAGVTFSLGCRIEGVSRLGEGFEVVTSRGKYSSSSLVIATGGLSIPKIGATDFGYRVASQFDLQIVPTVPALDGFTFKEARLFSELAGVSADCTMMCNGVSFRENVLFTHSGLSGPAALQASLHWNSGDSIFIRLMPDLEVTEWLLHKKRDGSQALVKTLLSECLPSRLAEKLCESFKLEPLPLSQLSDRALRDFAEKVQGWELHPNATVGYGKAEVTRGGVDTEELSSKTMEAKKVPGLYFIGEVVDVTGWLGGYNFQWAWASGWCAGQVV